MPSTGIKPVFVFATILLSAALVNSAIMADAEVPASVSGKYETKASSLLSNGTSAEGIIHRTFAAISELTGGIEGMQEYIVVQELNNKTGSATSTGWGAFTGKVAGKGPGKAVFSFVATIERIGTPQAKLQGRFWLERGTGGLEGTKFEGTFQGTTQTGGVYEGQVTLGQEVVERVSPVTYVGIVGGVAIAAAGIAIGIRTGRKQQT